MESEKTCFAETENGKCLILTVKKCKGHEKCTMFKTQEQAEADRQKSLDRIASLPLTHQSNISMKFYNNKRPWDKVV